MITSYIVQVSGVQVSGNQTMHDDHTTYWVVHTLYGVCCRMLSRDGCT